MLFRSPFKHTHRPAVLKRVFSTLTQQGQTTSAFTNKLSFSQKQEKQDSVLSEERRRKGEEEGFGEEDRRREGMRGGDERTGGEYSY